MLGRTTRIVCLAAMLAPAGFATQAHAQSMDAMSALLLSNRFMTPVSQYQPIHFTAEDEKQTAGNRAAAQITQVADYRSTEAADKPEQPIQQISAQKISARKVAEPR